MQCMMSKCLSSKKWTKWKVEQWRIWQKKVSIAHWTSTEKLSIMGPNPILICIWYFLFFSYILDFTSYLLITSGSLGLILGPDILERDILARDISAQTFHHGDFSARGHFVTRTFQHWYISAPWTFWNRDVTALGHFSTRMFQHMDIFALVHFGTAKQYRHFCTDILARVPLCRNVLMPKNSCDEMAMSKCLLLK